jgi:hypothetical protein
VSKEVCRLFDLAVPEDLLLKDKRMNKAHVIAKFFDGFFPNRGSDYAPSLEVGQCVTFLQWAASSGTETAENCYAPLLLNLTYCC